MPNESGAYPNKSVWAAGNPISASEMRRIVDTLASRITGDGKTILVRAFPGGQLCIEGIGRGAAGGVAAPYTVARVDALPDIPSSGMLEVFWNASLADDPENGTFAGTGDGQVWRAYAGQIRWTPTQKFTSKVGLPL